LIKREMNKYKKVIIYNKLVANREVSVK
jgi:hypothetical protein